VCVWGGGGIVQTIDAEAPGPAGILPARRGVATAGTTGTAGSHWRHWQPLHRSRQDAGGPRRFRANGQYYLLSRRCPPLFPSKTSKNHFFFSIARSDKPRPDPLGISSRTGNPDSALHPGPSQLIRRAIISHSELITKIHHCFGIPGLRTISMLRRAHSPIVTG
jgi:hypothetical protein